MEENTPVAITPYYWRNREKVLRKIAEKKATAEGREAFNEYQREYQRRYKARKLAVAKELRKQHRAEFIKRISRGSDITAPADPAGIPAGAPAGETKTPAAPVKKTVMRFISEVPAGWTPPAGNFTIAGNSWM
jgi:hypothetical protein